MEPCLCALRHLTSPHRATDAVQNEFRALGGLKFSIRALEASAPSWPRTKAACGLIKNLINYEENHETLVDLDVIPRLTSVLGRAYKEEKKVKNGLVDMKNEKSLN